MPNESEDMNAILKALGVDEDFDYRDNHPNEMVATAMEVIIQISNDEEDGLHSITPDMKQYLMNAISCLEELDDKTPQINSLIRNGKYYLNNFDVVDLPSSSSTNEPKQPNTVRSEPSKSQGRVSIEKGISLLKQLAQKL